jgi:molybdopterin-biosynthesis enzyme MoeA-like protein
MMGEFPVGSQIIPNPYNRIPGFSLRGHHFLPGFPQMAWPMMAWVLDTYYSGHFAPGRIGERSIIVTGCGESQLIDLMNACLARYPACKVFSLPRMHPERHVELGVRGDANDVVTAIQELQDGVTGLGFDWSAAPPPGRGEKKPA